MRAIAHLFVCAQSDLLTAAPGKFNEKLGGAGVLLNRRQSCTFADRIFLSEANCVVCMRAWNFFEIEHIDTLHIGNVLLAKKCGSSHDYVCI